MPQAESSGQRLTQRAQVLLEILVSQHLPIPGEVDRHFGGRMGPDGREAGGSSCWLRWGSGYWRDPAGGRPGNVGSPGAGGSTGRRQLDAERTQSPQEDPL